jgi:uncharacterized protein
VNNSDPGKEPAPPLVPFTQFLWKVASRCNLDCTYCFVYHLADQRWREQPKLMSEETARQTARRIREHLEAHDRRHVLVTFHGGEPMLAGAKRLARYLEIVDEELIRPGFVVRFSMQSNLTLFDEEIGDLLLKYGFTVGTSLDGPPEVNDRVRVDHRGRGSSAATERGLQLMTSPAYRDLFDGILCVIDPFSDPIAVLEHLRSFTPGLIDFLLPLGNHDRLPAGKGTEAGADAAPYGDWLIRSFDHWWSSGASPKIRIFDTIMGLACGHNSPVESLGLEVIDLVVVETNGDIEGLDSLKGTFEGATVLGFNVHQDSFDGAARHAMVKLRQIGIDQLCDTCRQCSVVKICGGGYLPHRYSAERGFDNPSVYCRDLENLIRHIYGSLESVVRAEAPPPIANIKPQPRKEPSSWQTSWTPSTSTT